MITVTLDLKDLDREIERLSNISGELTDWSPYFRRAISRDVRGLAHQQFTTRGRRSWPPLSPVTVRRHRDMHIPNPTQPLVETGQLRARCH